MLSQPGCIVLKGLCFSNLHLDAHSADENGLLDKFLSDANSVSKVWKKVLKSHFITSQNYWPVDELSKTANDIRLRFREERNT